MSEQLIKCPNCGTEIELTEALTETIRNSLRGDVEEAAAKGQAELLKHRKAVAAKEKELSEREQSIDEAVADRLRTERDTLKKATLEKAEKEYGARANSLEAELEEKAKKLAQAEQKELALLKQKRELEEAKQTFELEVERKLAVESKKLQKNALEKAAQAQVLKLRQKDDLIESLRKQMGEMQRRVEVGSQEAQGEALEGQLHDVLSAAFPIDAFDEIKKGARGADILQTVRNAGGAICGHILWESKNTKQFQKSWIAKLKKDQQAASADVAVLMSMALPEGIEDFAFSEEDDIWLTAYLSVVPLCTALRHGLIQVAREKIVSQHRDTYKGLVYDYVTGQDFARRVRAIVDAHVQMREDLETEKRSMNRIWSKREKQIALVLDNVTGLHGELEGLAGVDKSLPGIAPLMLESVAPDDDAEDS